MEFENIIKLIETVSKSNLTQFSYENDGVVVKMKTDKEKCAVTFSESKPAFMPTTNVAAPLAQTESETISGHQLKSPLVGTFYASPSPEEEPFVKVGDRVSKGQMLGIVEAMKLLNEIESDFDGVIKEICVSNEEVVEYDQVMFVIDHA